ncbi:MAG: diheme cytochrome c precursor [Pirellulaceae bacterium]|nr:diheme cytochrome c precursor [Pirellulaceae bacterium]
MNRSEQSGLRWILAATVMSLAVVGYFTGLQSPMHRYETALESGPAAATVIDRPIATTPLNSIVDSVVPATHYSQMSLLTRSRRSPPANFSELQTARSLNETITIEPTDKVAALAQRSANRAFNGAPPTVPHPIDQLSSAACIACHGAGLSLSTVRASQMSHPYLAGCTQCHVEHNPQHLPPNLFGETTFVGLPAPSGGPRAYPGAPPQIPHATWMRQDCLSCHGPGALLGLRTTHPWRQECQQCHAPAATFEQVKLNPQPAFLEPPKVID